MVSVATARQKATIARYLEKLAPLANALNPPPVHWIGLASELGDSGEYLFKTPTDSEVAYSVETILEAALSSDQPAIVKDAIMFGREAVRGIPKTKRSK